MLERLKAALPPLVRVAVSVPLLVLTDCVAKREAARGEAGGCRSPCP